MRQQLSAPENNREGKSDVRVALNLPCTASRSALKLKLHHFKRRVVAAHLKTGDFT